METLGEGAPTILRTGEGAVLMDLGLDIEREAFSKPERTRLLDWYRLETCLRARRRATEKEAKR
jgi:hypothetical protein